jgi:5-oxoprolinase (ATP-hydrolysing) subunit A
MARRLRDDCAAKGIALRPMAEVLGV